MGSFGRTACAFYATFSGSCIYKRQRRAGTNMHSTLRQQHHQRAGAAFGWPGLDKGQNFLLLD